ncbi:MAG: hypothetical protein Q7S04_04210 [Candidatus Moranbacteria bacterium]|nr:hypothetical protein [Candidatus Moranbacteria bacterium]
MIIIAVISAIMLLGGGGYFWYQKFQKSRESVTKVETPAEKNYFEINDEVAGVYFKVGKKFERMPARDLQVKNASFVYGFSSSDDKTVACYVSQTKRDQPGVVKVSALRDGVFEQVKKTFSDAKLDTQEIVEVGENNNKGAKLKMSYTNADIPMLQWEVVGITDKVATFGFCELPAAVLDLYQDDINLFLDSLRIK